MKSAIQLNKCFCVHTHIKAHTENFKHYKLLIPSKSRCLFHYCYRYPSDEKSVDPHQLASTEASRSGASLFSKDGTEF